MKGSLVRAIGFLAFVQLGACSEQEAVELGNVEGVLANARRAFTAWAKAQGKEYVDDANAFEKRLSVFTQNALFVQAHNEQHPATTLELNSFADLTYDEFAGQYLGYNPSLAMEPDASVAKSARLSGFRYATLDAPASMDWVEQGAVTAVKNQGQCGSCWAFSTTGSIEGINFIKTGELVELSEQELVDCDKSHDQGCGGGLMDNAFEYVFTNKGIDTEEDYVYWGPFPSFCNRRKQADRHVVDISGYEDVPENDEVALERAVANQPVSVAICANQALMFYKGGVFDASCCTGLNHGVLAVGYGTSDEGKPFWKVKNSWGGAWGEDGYFRLLKDKGGEGQCGIAMDASYPVKDDLVNPKMPTICDPQWFSLWECPVQTECACEINVFGLFCLAYTCDPTDAVACGDGVNYCPSEAANCSFEDGRCYSNDGELNSSMLTQRPAHKRDTTPMKRM